MHWERSHGLVSQGLPAYDWCELSRRFCPTRSGVMNPNPLRVKPCPNQEVQTKNYDNMERDCPI